jgi:uracil-DNA glycosylase family protein
MPTKITRPGAQQWIPARPSLTSLRGSAGACRGCELWEPATQVVFSEGKARAALMLVGEQPGDVEDKNGRPFVGPAGGLLRKALAEAGIDSDNIYLTNAVKHFRFQMSGKRRMHEKPGLVHVHACQPWLEAEMQVLHPELIVVLGSVAASALLGSDFRVTHHRGEIVERETDEGLRRFLITVHPSSVLRTPTPEREAAHQAFVTDLRVAAERLT